MQIKDIFFIKTILDRATAGSHNGEAGYYSVSDNMFSEGHSCYCDNGSDWYNDLKGIFDCSSTLSGTNWSSNDQHEFDSGHYSMTVVKMAANNYLSILVGGQNVSLNYDGNYYYTQNYYSNYGGTWFRWDYINGELTYVKTYYGGSYATIDENVETTLYSSMPIMMYYSNADRNINYARIAGDQGVGPGGWQVPNPNPTRKIVINGSEPDDIKLNGVTPDKIMLNGQCYFEKAPEPDPHNYLYKWDFTKSLVDEKQGVEAELRGYEQSWATRDSSGVHITGAKQFVAMGNEQISLIGKTIEIDISEFNFQGDSSKNTLILSYDRYYSGVGDYPCYLFYYSSTDSSWSMYGWKGASVNYESWKQIKTISNELSLSAINDKTIKCTFNSDGTNDFYLNDVLIGSTSECWANNGNALIDNKYIKIGSTNKRTDGTNGNSYNMTVSGVRIYENEE